MKTILTLLLLISTAATAQEKIDYVNLGATLLKDGYLQRAKSVLQKADVRKPDFDFARYYSLKGILLHRLGYPTISNIFFDASRKHGQDNPSIFLYMARNHWQRQDYAGVIEALEMAGDVALDNEQMYVIKAESQKQLGDIKEAWATIDAGVERFPEYARFYRQKFYYLLELTYYQQAMEYADKYLEKKEYTAKDYLAVSFVLRENKRFDQAAALLEEAVIRHSQDERLIELLGQIYIDQEKYLMAALVYDFASLRFPDFSHKAATLYLKAQQPIRSLQLNRRIGNQEEKFRQRLGIDIYLEDYESLVTKTDALKRYGLLKDENVTYAIGYGYFRNGEFDKAKAYLKRITDSGLFTKVSQVFNEIENCKNDPAACL
jgi:tetratricopeptide (TPR) repeat protein